MTPILLFLVALNIGHAISTTEIFKNPGFESGVSGWQHQGFLMSTAADDVYEGVAAVLCTHRTSSHQGPGQTVTLTPGATYNVSAWVKVAACHGHAQGVNVKVRYEFGGGRAGSMAIVGSTRFLTQSDGWVQVGGYFDVPHRAHAQALVHVDGPQAHCDFHMDEASLTQVQDNAHWRQDADVSIEANRKSDLHMTVTLDPSLNPSDVTMRVRQLKHKFGWGSLVNPDWMIDPDYHQYQKVVYAMFNWATIQDYKWKFNRGNVTHPDYSVARAATEVLRSSGMHVRGHAMFWAVTDKNPDDVQKMTGATLKQTVDTRTEYMTNLTHGALDHWDVNNELLHGHFFELHTGDPHITEHMFTLLHSHDPKPLLFLNDFSIVSRGQGTYAYLDQIKRFKAANVNLGGVGIQSHFNDGTEPNPTLMKARLDHIAKAGVPIWITELDMAAPNEQKTADYLETMYRLYFSHPMVKGVIHWGFWEHDMPEPEKALVQGYGFELTPGGERFLQLTRDTWSTKVNLTLQAKDATFDLRGFRGNYEAVVYYRGQPVQLTNFFLGDHSKSLHLTVPANPAPVTLPDRIALANPFNSTGATHPHTNTTHLHDVGHATADSTRTTLECTSRWSAMSIPSAGAHVEKGCNDGEILTGCSSLLKNSDWHKDGEKIMMIGGKPVCRATDGYRTTAGVQAVARCCSLQGLSCTYRQAGPSGTGVDDRVEASCGQNTTPLGCTAWSPASHSDGALAINTSCVAQNDAPKTGVYAFAVCCSAPRLQCHSLQSSPSGLSAGDKATVGCPGNEAMTGCQGYSQFGRIAGAYVSKDSGTDLCTAVNGADKHSGEEGVKAVASCCTVG